MYGETRLCFLSFKSIYGDMRFGILSPHNHLMSRDSVSFLLYQCMETLDSASSPYNRWVSRDSVSLFSYQCIGTWDSASFLHIIVERHAGLGIHSFQKNATFSRSFAFFSKERNILAFFCVLYKKNAAFFVFFYLLSKRTLHSLRSLRSFTFFIKECGVLCDLLCSV